MKKHLLFSIVGGIILFIWQFLSYAMPNFHQKASTYTPLQDTILATLQEVGLEEGMYMLGMPDPDDPEAMKKYQDMKESTWASLNYQVNDSNSMGMPMARGVVVCIIISAILFMLFNQQKDPTLIKRIVLAVSIGLIGFFFVPYSNFIWYKEPDVFAHFLDAFVPWIILGFIGHKMLEPKA